MNNIDELNSIEKEITLLRGMEALLDFDHETIMPKAAVSERAEQSAYISTKIHELMTSNELSTVLDELEKEKLSDIEIIRVKKLQKEVKKSKALPTEFVEKLAKHKALSFHAWEEARKNNNFKGFAKELDIMIELQKQKANYIDSNAHPYDILLDDFEEGMTVEKTKKVLEELKTGLLKILDKINGSEISPKDVFEGKSFPKEQQDVVVKELKKLMLMEDNRSLLAISTHPFTTRISSDDVRITTAFRGNQPMFSLTSTMHEAGHGLYELGFPKEYTNTLLFDAPSYGLHESQSRFWELFIGLSKEFWKGYYPEYQKRFSDLKNVSLDDFYKSINKVEPTPIRIESDEVHYCLHIVVRFEIELGLMEGKIKTNDLSREWNSRYKKYLGIEPKSFSEGVLQDVHWAQGYFGYFPTYAIGTMYSAMLFDNLLKTDKNALKQISELKFKPILDYLRKNIHKYGSSMLADEIIEKTTGKKLTPDNFLEYLDKKYSKIYNYDLD